MMLGYSKILHYQSIIQMLLKRKFYTAKNQCILRYRGNKINFNAAIYLRIQ